MKVSRKNILQQARDLLLFFLVSLVQSYLMCPGCIPDGTFWLIVLFTFVMWIVLWKGNAFLSELLSRMIPWIQFPVKRFVLGMVITISFTVLAVIILLALFEKGSGIVFGAAYRYTLYGSVIITILISFFLHARQFLLFWQKASFEKEKFEKESIKAQYESLKNQVSPHFLFNSLNALTNLVYEDREKAVEFIRKLSAVYRYVLDTREKEMVPLSEELKFIDSYLYLQQIRFGSKLKVAVAMNGASTHVAPLALQMLIENAIKHNIVSEEDPLTIQLYAEEGFLVVRNNLQRKSIPGDSFSGVGLENIRRRYEFLSDKKVRIDEDGKTFTVRLPAIT
jgi:LytS/YehU family sensor histidine kinase